MNHPTHVCKTCLIKRTCKTKPLGKNHCYSKVIQIGRRVYAKQ